MTIENVVYRKVPDVSPCVQFYSMPVSVVGGGSSVAEASDRFEQALADIEPSNVDVVAHTEIRAADGVFIRMRLGADQEARMAGVNEVMKVITQSNPDDVDRMFDSVAASGDVIIVISQPHDTIGDVLDQMTTYDALWLALNSNGGKSIDFITIRGGAAEGEADEDARPINPVDDRDRTLADVFGGLRASHQKQLALA